jgi:uncharacterized protein (DUF4415 family)
MTLHRTRQPVGVRETAEAAFKAATTKPVALALEPKASAVPNAKALVTLRIDQDVLAHVQDGPGWQERINAALRKAVGL